jgi:hypothetical protein
MSLRRILPAECYCHASGHIHVQSSVPGAVQISAIPQIHNNGYCDWTVAGLCRYSFAITQ